jgi:hypothetical protein
MLINRRLVRCLHVGKGLRDHWIEKISEMALLQLLRVKLIPIRESSVLPVVFVPSSFYAGMNKSSISASRIHLSILHRSMAL